MTGLPARSAPAGLPRPEPARVPVRDGRTRGGWVPGAASRGRRRATAVALALVAWVTHAAWRAVAATGAAAPSTPTATATATATPPPDAIGSGAGDCGGPVLDGGAVRGALTPQQDVLLVPGATHPGPAPRILGATLVPDIRAEQVRAVLVEPRALRAALPALIRADVVATRAQPATPGPAGPAAAVTYRLVAWELEIPFFNLSGKLWLSERGDAVEFQLVEGAFAPGWLRFRTRPDPITDGTVVTCESQLSVESTNWLIRRLARHDPWAETAMSAAINWVALRAVALGAGLPPGAPARRPTGTIEPPTAAVRGDDLLTPAFEPWRALGTLLRVRRREGGRLAFVSGAATVARAAPEVAVRLAAPESWTAFPGWKTVLRRPGDPSTFDVVDDIAFVDLDATWRLLRGADAAGAAACARAIHGSTTGAMLSWDIGPTPAARSCPQPPSQPPSPARAPSPDALARSAPSPTGPRTTAVLSMHPRLDAAGFIERRMIAAEPLLEHALAIGLVYADVTAVADALAREAAGRPIR